MSELLDKQFRFSRLLSRLLDYAHFLGFEVTMGETYRPEEMAEIYAERGIGIRNSLHTMRLAVDLHLFRDGEFLTDTEEYRDLGEWWEGLSDDEVTCCWGGRFGDGGHFSVAHAGRK